MGSSPRKRRALRSDAAGKSAPAFERLRRHIFCRAAAFYFGFVATGDWFGCAGFARGADFSREISEKADDKAEKGETLQVLDQIIEKCGRYFWIRTVVSVIQGICSSLAALALGLDLPFIWGLSAALLNYLPTVGSLISVVPPALFALFQFQDVGRAGLVFFVMCAIQLLLGTFVDPLLSGRQLKVSAFLVLFSIAFWGWVWGIAGALIGVPLTVTLLIVCSHFEETKWIADLFAGADEQGEASEAPK